MKKKSSSSLKVISATCVAAGLVSTWDMNADAQVSFSGQITPTHDLSDVYFMFAVGTCGSVIYTKKISDFLPANTTTAFNFTMNSLPAGSPVAFEQYSILSLYDVANGNVSLSYNPYVGNNLLALGTAPTWDTTMLPSYIEYYGGLLYINVGVTEADLAADLSSGTYNGINMDDALAGGPFFPGYGSSLFSNDATAPSNFDLINFSGASDGGSGFIVEVVPEPSTLALLGAGTALLAGGWLRRRHAS